MAADQQGEGASSLEQITFNNTVSIEAMLEILIRKKVFTEQEFFEAKRTIEQRIMSGEDAM